MQLRFNIEGATDEELRRGLNAALEFFDKAKMHPEIAAEGMFALEDWATKGFPEGGLSDKENAAARVWMKAEQAAIEACCADWPSDRHRPGKALEARAW